MNIKTVIDHVRGCGTRKPGGLYLVSSGLLTPCGRLPIRLERCPRCSRKKKTATSLTHANRGTDKKIKSELLVATRITLHYIDTVTVNNSTRR